MIQHKVDGGIVSTDKVIVNVDGSDVEVLKVNVVQDDVTSEIYPSAASKLRVMSNKDEDFSGGKIGEQRFAAPRMSYGEDIELYIEVWPENAAWYFEAHGDLNLDHLQYEEDGVTTKVYYGNQTLSLDLVDLEENQESLEQSFSLKPYKGEESNSVTFWFLQSKPVVADIPYEVEFNFNDNLSDASRQYEFVSRRNTEVVDAYGDPIYPVQYASGVNNNGTGLVIEYQGEYGEETPINQYYVDISSRIPWNWFETGLTLSMVSSTFDGEVGLLERQDINDPTVYLEGNAGNHMAMGYYFAAPSYEIGPAMSGYIGGVGERIVGDSHSVLTVSTIPLTDERVSMQTEREGSTETHTFTGRVNFEGNTVTFTGFDLGDLRASDTIKFDSGPTYESGKTTIVRSQIDSNTYTANYISRDEIVTEDRAYTIVITRLPADISVTFTPNLDDPETTQEFNIQAQYLIGSNAFGSLDHMYILMYEAYRNGQKTVKGSGKLVHKNLNWVTGVPLEGDQVWVNEEGDTTIKSGISTIGHWYNQDGSKENSGFIDKPGNGILGINMPNSTLNQTIPESFIDHLGIVFERVEETVVVAECKAWGIPVAGGVTSEVPPLETANPRFRQALAFIDNGQYPTYDDVPIYNTKIKPMVVDDETLCIGGAMSYFWEDRIKKEYPNTWVYEHNHYYKHQWWQAEYYFNANWNVIKETYYRRILYSWDNPDNFTINDITDPENPVKVNFSLEGRWTAPNGTIRFRSQLTDRMIEARDEAIANGDEEIPDVLVKQGRGGMMNNYDMNQYLYVKLENPLEQGHEYEVVWNDTGDHTNTGTMVYDENTPARSIKVNQMGYVNDSTTTKNAYFGSWLGMLANNLEKVDENDPGYAAWREAEIAQEYRQYKPLDNPRVTGAFSIYRDGESTPVYTKTAEESNFNLRDVNDRVYWDPANSNMEGIRGVDDDTTIHKWETGEETYDISFSDIDVPDGKYRLYIDGIGWSWPFFIGNEAAGRGFFVAHKGLLELRSGIDLDEPYSFWPKVAKAPETFEGVGPAIQESFTNGDITTSAGAFSSSHWQTYSYEKDNSGITGRRFRDVKGGWHDAADFDRRPMHLRAVNPLVEAYLAEPEKFYDGQLNIPESGDGIPDILSEAEWGVRIWRQLQREDGAITMWVESAKHEDSLEGQESDLEYICGAYNTHDSLLYAHSAAMLAQAFSMVGTEKARAKSAIYAESAARAYAFGREEDNLANTTWFMNGSVHEYNENVEYRKPNIYPAAAALFALTRNKKYADDLTDENFNSFFDKQSTDWGNYLNGLASFALFLQIEDIVPAHHDKYVTWVRLLTKFWMVSREKFHYRWSGLFSGTYEETRVSEDKYGFVMSIPALWAPGFSDFTYFAGDHIENRAGTAYLYMLRYSKKHGNTEDIQLYKDALQMSLDHNNGCTPNGMCKTTGMGHTYPAFFLDYKMLGHIAQGIYTPAWGHSPYDGGQIPAFFSNYSGVTATTWANIHGSRADMYNQAANQNMMPGGFIEKLGDGGSSVASFLMNRIPKWRTQSYMVGAKNAGMSEWTVWETAGGKVPMYAALMEPGWMPADEVKSPHIEREDRFNVDGYLTMP